MPRGRPRKNPIPEVSQKEEVSQETLVLDTHCHQCGWGKEYGAKLWLIGGRTLCQNCK